MRFVFSSALVVLTLILAAPNVGAQGVNDFVITDFDATYTLTNEDPQGLLTVTELIQLDFTGQNQGILRAIPSEYKGNDLGLQVISVSRGDASEPYITYQENDNTVIRIGESGNFITGEQAYVLNYQLENVVSFYDDYDELYWDINGNQWLQTFENVSVDLTAAATAKSTIEAECFVGLFGAPDSDGSRCSLVQKTNGLDAETTSELSANETLTVVQAYDKGYFTPPTFLEKYSKYIPAAVAALAQLFAVVWAYSRWKKYGKDYSTRPTAPFFGRPKQVSVMQASYLKENKLTPRHISAAIIDLSIRGYIKLSEQKDGKKVSHRLKLLKKPDKSLTEDEKILLDAVFVGGKVSSTVNLEEKKNKLYKTSQKLANQLDSHLKKKGYYELSPKKAFSKIMAPFLLSLASGIVCVMLAELTGGISIVIGGVGFIAVIALGSLMSKRSQVGVELLEHMDGLNLYLEKAEKDRLKMQDAVAAPLAPNTGEPTRDVKFFEKLLPFAVAAGVENTWANAFQDIYSQPPDWYSGNWSSFNTAALASSLSNTSKVASSSFSAPSNSGSSGSSGGGFSGGGGGGGGGGGW